MIAARREVANRVDVNKRRKPGEGNAIQPFPNFEMESLVFDISSREVFRQIPEFEPRGRW
jgi:hypothetical protein